jgi:hypothetical protein
MKTSELLKDLRDIQDTVVELVGSMARAKETKPLAGRQTRREELTRGVNRGNALVQGINCWMLLIREGEY